jgi:predicted phosphodiesterase
MAIKFLTFSDLHAPVQDPAAVRWMLDTIERERPDLIVANGDMLDGDAWSRWENEHDWTILDEYREWAKIAREINRLAPNALRVWLYGNHEANLWEPGRVPKKLRGIVHWKDYRPEGVPCLAEEMRGWRLVTEYGSHIRWSCGPIVFTHGTKAGINAARDEARMHGHAFSLTISGHTHRPVHVTRSVRQCRQHTRGHLVRELRDAERSFEDALYPPVQLPSLGPSPRSGRDLQRVQDHAQGRPAGVC